MESKLNAKDKDKDNNDDNEFATGFKRTSLESKDPAQQPSPAVLKQTPEAEVHLIIKHKKQRKSPNESKR